MGFFRIYWILDQTDCISCWDRRYIRDFELGENSDNPFLDQAGGACTTPLPLPLFFSRDARGQTQHAVYIHGRYMTCWYAYTVSRVSLLPLQYRPVHNAIVIYHNVAARSALFNRTDCHCATPRKGVALWWFDTAGWPACVCSIDSRISSCHWLSPLPHYCTHSLIVRRPVRFDGREAGVRLFHGFGVGVSWSPSSPERSCSPNFNLGCGGVLQTKLGDIAPTVSLFCFLFSHVTNTHRRGSRRWVSGLDAKTRSLLVGGGTPSFTIVGAGRSAHPVFRPHPPPKRVHGAAYLSHHTVIMVVVVIVTGQHHTPLTLSNLFCSCNSGWILSYCSK